MNCALCHGGLDNKPSALEHSFYPPPPQLVLDPLDDPEWHIFFVGPAGFIRRTDERPSGFLRCSMLCEDGRDLDIAKHRGESARA